ncbi:hypothetical protein B5M42_001245 [Paenibacillus athensensis]|uniref:Uncharacterized protein n=1 Tax=Paenibacillus athensensis TaxID=1967502 RepID=A0A4Y8Q6W8_9BACL|nr:hypothetical protein [Paenibacillus athensensis]MCD1257462.1 hypothetical protein [Paenibacillus athensensis]
MAIFMLLAIVGFLTAMTLIMLSFTKWAQENAPWLSSLYIYIAIGALIGLSLYVIAAYVFRHYHPEIPVLLE